MRLPCLVQSDTGWCLFSVRGLLHFMPKTASRKLLSSQPSESRFSRTDMWRGKHAFYFHHICRNSFLSVLFLSDLMHDLTSVRVVNGKHQDGSMLPLLLTSSEMKIGDQQLYSLLFEPIRNKNVSVGILTLRVLAKQEHSTLSLFR